MKPALSFLAWLVAAAFVAYAASVALQDFMLAPR